MSKKNHYKHFTPEEDAMLLAPNFDAVALSKKLDRAINSITKRRRKLINDGVTETSINKTPRSTYSAEEDELILSTESNHVAALLLKRSRAGVQNRRMRLVNEYGRVSVPTKSFGFLKAKAIVAQMRKEALKNNGSILLPVVSQSVSSTIERIPIAETKMLPMTTSTKVHKKANENQEEGFIVVINNTEMTLKQLPKKMIVSGKDLTFSFEE